MGLWACLATSIMNEEDDFRVRMRKSVLTILFLPTSFFFAAGALGAISVLKNVDPMRYVAVIAFLLLVVMFASSYFVMRYKRAVSGNHLVFVFWTFAILMQIFYGVYPGSDTKAIIFAAAAMVLMTQMRGMLLCLAFLAVQALLLDWNRAALTSESSQELVLALPGYFFSIQNAFANGLASSASGTLILAGVVYMFHLQIAEAERRGAAQTAAQEMTMRVLRRQRRYDTEEVRKILDDCSQARIVDPELIRLFRQMNGHLEIYRPFLPNYLFLGVDDQGGDDDGAGRASEVGDADVASLILSDMPLAIFQMGSSDQEESTGDELSESGESSSSPERASSFSSQSLGDSSHARDSAKGSSNTSSNPLENIPPPTSNIVVGGVTGLQLRQSKGGPTEGAQHFTSSAAAARSFSGVIAEAWIELQSNDWFSTKLVRVPFSSRSARHQRNTLSVFTEALFDLAQTTKASVHSLVGDSVQLSWNATHRVTEPEQKAATFLLRLREALATALPDVKLAAAACSGHAEVHSTTSHGTRQRAMYVDAPWLPALECCYALAKRYKTLIVDGNIESRSCFAVVAQGVDCIRYVPKVVLVPGTAEPGMGSLEGPNPFIPKGFPFALPDTYDTLLGLQGPQQEEAAQTFLERKPVQHTIAYELVKRKEQEDGREDHEWLYAPGSQSDINDDDHHHGSRTNKNRKKEIEPLVTKAVLMAADDRAADAALFLVENGVFGVEGAVTGGTSKGTESTSENGTRRAVYESIFLNQDSGDEDEFREDRDPDYIPTSGGGRNPACRVYDPIAAAVARAADEAHQGQEEDKTKEKVKLPRNTLLLQRLAKYCHCKTLPVGAPPPAPSSL